ncbi:unnamed protein product [Lactuca saligna]|uniref:ER lumen protein-retaining receptor n=1 Tax=Lactuca saligna TaxID=75948 RepID=A0AA36EG03_LACSI|nr:unnamed protein product [Lactuca saligna]
MKRFLGWKFISVYLLVVILFPAESGLVSKWRPKDRMKTGCVALVLCLNISVDSPDVIKISPCARIISRLQNVQICWAFSIYLEAVAILPQLVLLQRSGNADNLIGQYVFFLGAYRALNILNWICRYLTQPHFNGWISCFSSLIQTALYADFFYYYFIRLYEEGHLRLYSSPGW